jgi:hypothetical protein
MEIDEAIKSAHDAVVEADLPPSFQGVAFAQVLRHLLTESLHPSSSQASQPAPSATADMVGLGRLAERMNVSTSVLADLFEVAGDSISLHVASSRIATRKSRATREIALLIAAARQGSGVDESWSAVSHVREALQNYKRYDPNNFSAYLKAIGDAFNFRGKGSSMELRLTQPGWEMATNLIGELAGKAL